MTNFLEKSVELDKIIQSPDVHQQVEEMVQIDQYVKKGMPMPKAPAPLGLLPDQFEDILQEIGINKKRKLRDINNLFNNFRQYLSLKYGIWSVANINTARLIKKKMHVKNALEIMAGNAYWSHVLEETGITVISTDSLEWAKTSSTGARPFHKVIDLKADQAIEKYQDVDLILCSWSPNFGNSDIETIAAWRKFNPNSHLLFIGEKDGATNSVEFWSQDWFKQTKELREINRSFQSFDFINEQIFEINNEF
uniref:SAM-dependent methyltransferase n=1 Tax=Lactobacillus acidophilus TaxID=1579 RepID=UPI003F5638D5